MRGERVPLPGAVPLRERRARGGRARAPGAHEAPGAGGRHARHLAAALLLLLRVRAHRRRPPRRHEGAAPTYCAYERTSTLLCVANLYYARETREPHEFLANNVILAVR